MLMFTEWILVKVEKERILVNLFYNLKLSIKTFGELFFSGTLILEVKV